MLIAALFLAVGLGLAVYGVAAQRAIVVDQPDHVDLALGQATVDADEDVPRPGLLYRVLAPVLDAAARLLRRLSPARRLTLSRQRIVLAGLESTWTLEKLLSYKAAGALAGLGLGLLSGGPAHVPRLLWAVLLGGLASFAPDMVISGRATKRQEAIARALPEALDLLALTVEAGLGFEQALEVVVDNSSGPLTGEFARLLREVELGVPRREALAALRERTDVPELASFVVALVQSDQMGIALADVLKSQAGQVRLKRRQRAKEQAAKTPVKILFPVVLGIFPALFVVTIGPGAIKIAQGLL